MHVMVFCDQAAMKISAKKDLSLQKHKAVSAASRRHDIAAGGEVQVPWVGIYEWLKVEQGG